MDNEQIFSPTVWMVSSVYRPFLLLSRSFLVSCSPICTFFLLVAELQKLLSIEEVFAYTDCFQSIPWLFVSDIKVLDPF
jgi:hypothetical protein